MCSLPVFRMHWRCFKSTYHEKKEFPIRLLRKYLDVQLRKLLSGSFTYKHTFLDIFPNRIYFANIGQLHIFTYVYTPRHAHMFHWPWGHVRERLSMASLSSSQHSFSLLWNTLRFHKVFFCKVAQYLPKHQLLSE